MIPKHCPRCGRGLSAKYHTGQHPLRTKLKVFRRSTRPMCLWVPNEG